MYVNSRFSEKLSFAKKNHKIVYYNVNTKKYKHIYQISKKTLSFFENLRIKLMFAFVTEFLKMQFELERKFKAYNITNEAFNFLSQKLQLVHSF